jgi:hypothetical protein
MSNFNTFADVILHQNNGAPLVLNFPSTGHTAFALGAGTAVLNVPNPLSLIDSGGHFPGRAATAIPFILRAAGLIQVGGGVKYQLDINQGTGVGPAIATSSLITAGGGLVQDNFLIECEMVWDSVSTNLRGIQYGWVGNTAIAQAVTSAVTVTSLAALQFTVAATVQNINAANTFTLTEFSAELV